MVVSEIMERLSPNIAPLTTAPIQTAIENPVFSLIPMAMGASAPMVPILVPMETDMKQPMSISPATAIPGGRMDNPRATVLSAPPAAVTVPEKAPAARKIRHMVTIFSSPTPAAMIFSFSSKDRLRFWRNATIRAIRNATTAGIP